MRLNPIDGILYLSMKMVKVFDRRDTDLKYFDPEKVKNILIVSSTAIGDTLLSTPAIRAIRERYPDTKIIAHFNKSNMEMFENNPHIDGIIPYYGGYEKIFKIVREFRKHKFDLALILHGNEPQATPMCYLSGARYIFKLPNTTKYNFLLANKSPVLAWKDFGHCIEQGLKVAELADAHTYNKKMELVIERRDEDAVDLFLKREGISSNNLLIGFQVSASNINTMWFPDRFAELGRKIISEYPDLKIIITGSPSERDYCEDIGRSIGAGVVVSAGKLPLKQIPALIKRFKLLVTGDTGIMHVAIANGTTVVALYAASDSKSTGPYYDMDKHIVLQKWKTCDPCVGKKCKYQECMENISVDEVFQATVEVLGRGF